MEEDEDEESTYEEEDDSQDPCVQPEQEHQPQLHQREQRDQQQQQQQSAGVKGDHSLVLETEECASCQLQSNSASNLLLHPNSIAVAGKASKDALDESLCGDPLMYATFVAPVHQYSTETEPSRQVKILSTTPMLSIGLFFYTKKFRR